MRLFKKYQSLRPDGVNAFYLTPLCKPREDRWYARSPVGHNTLSKTVAHLCKEAGVSGFHTNHSLRATAATHLYHNQVDEQLIMAVTGHKSTDGVRSYKRTSTEQFRDISNGLHTPKDQSQVEIDVPDKITGQSQVDIMQGVESKKE